MKLNQKTLVVYLLSLLSVFSCSKQKEEVKADTVIKGGTIYTMNTDQPKVEAVAVQNGKIIFAGLAKEAEAYIGDSTQVLDLKGQTMTPGFIEGHGHFMGLGYNELNLNLLDVKSYDELVERVKEAVAKAQPGQWITGRGWHQSKWTPSPEPSVKGFQTHQKLSEISPDNPVFLRHASGHAGFANAKAMEIAGVLQMSNESMEAGEVEGGEIIRDELGNPTGIFNETAMGLIAQHIPETTPEKDRQALELAVKACHAHGITSFHDAGVGREHIALFKEAKENGTLGVRLYVMLTGWDRELLEEWYKKGPEVDTTDHLLTIRSVKLNCDGALGSRGAWLLEEYTDRPGHFGHETLPMEFVYTTSQKALKSGFQVCSHAIGDRANKEILDRYEKAFKENPEAADNHRFRIEHAQHLHPEDIPRFAELGVIPAMQAIHMSSDRPWAIDRLGEKRIQEGAYVWQELLKSGARIVNGTDVPVEPVNPIACFYASVSRKTLDGSPEGGYEPEQKMTREQALRSYTLDAAYGAFEEDVKGSIEPGKLADFTVFSQDIMTVPEEELLKTTVEMTIVGGDVVYRKVDL
ncbi:amidohydrolase [Fulvivirga kasyanovii]|uniref:Amidohydrolase n=1 Tax=Fulvivirga kasyanovii TaxID=396812 RepID=A0ABW9RP20_9BACT|nr:amidohydrolase [Fulvivirga kasyanovii]MTI25436.1 amidohydrolase [Fulvivirga kasyanovii]